jgi:hypothetical protein
MKWAGHVARMGEDRNAYRSLVGKPERKRPLGRPRRRWVGNIKMDLLEIGWGGVGWIGLAQESTCECGTEPSGSIKCWETISGYTIGGLPSSSQFHSVSYLFVGQNDKCLPRRIIR